MNKFIRMTQIITAQLQLRRVDWIVGEMFLLIVYIIFMWFICLLFCLLSITALSPRLMITNPVDIIANNFGYKHMAE